MLKQIINEWRVDLALLAGPQVKSGGTISGRPVWVRLKTGEYVEQWEERESVALRLTGMQLRLAENILGFGIYDPYQNLVWRSGEDSVLDWRTADALPNSDYKRKLNSRIESAILPKTANAQRLIGKLQKLLCMDCPVTPERLRILQDTKLMALPPPILVP